MFFQIELGVCRCFPFYEKDIPVLRLSQLFSAVMLVFVAIKFLVGPTLILLDLV